MGLFESWREDKQAIWLSSVLGFAFVLTLVGIYINFQNNPFEQTRAMVFMIMLIWGIMFGIVDWSSKRQNILGGAGNFQQFGTIQKLMISGIAGIILTFLLSGAIFTSSPTAVSGLDSSSAIGGISLAFVYIVLIAPYAEEKFFASAVAPTSYRLFGGYAGLIITSGFFGLYHGYAYGWDFNQMLVAGTWRMLVLIGNQLFQSTGFSYLAHITNNYLAFTHI